MDRGTMEITVSGRKMPVTDALRAYAVDKIGGVLEQFDINPISCEVVLYKEKNKAISDSGICEVTVVLKGHIARVEESEEDMYAAIDVAAAKIARQLRKIKNRNIDKRKRRADAEAQAAFEDAAATEGELDLDRLMDELSADDIVRRKRIEFAPMTEEQALVQMDLIGHDFFVYTDRDSNEVHVLYRRTDGSYGILAPLDPDEDAE
jgi:putative sigma-54 modulation protein